MSVSFQLSLLTEEASSSAARSTAWAASVGRVRRK